MESLQDADEYGKVVRHGHSHRTSDSYTYSLLDVLRSSERPRLDYAFVDGSHTWYHDGFAFYLLDKMLRIGGILEFDGHQWSFAHSPDPKAVAFGQFLRPGQAEANQIHNVVTMLVEASGRYEVVSKDRIYRKLAHTGQCCQPVPKSSEDKSFSGKEPWFTLNRTRAMEIGIDEGVSSKKLAADFKNLHLVDFDFRVTKIKDLIRSRNGSGTMASVFTHGSTYRSFDSYTYTLQHMVSQSPRLAFNYVYIDAAHEWHHDGFTFFLADMLVPVGGIIAFDDYSWTIAGSHTVNAKKHPEVLQRFTVKQTEMAHVKEVVDVLAKEDPRYRVVQEGWQVFIHKVGETDGCCKDDNPWTRYD